MKGDVFLSNEEYLKQQDLIKSRQQRIIQVREQSKKMTAAILNRMKQEAEKQYQETENRVLSEIRQHYSRELATIRQHYNQCVSEINQQHYVKHTMPVNYSNVKKKPVLKSSVHECRNEEVESKKQSVKNLDAIHNKENEQNKKTLNSVTTINSEKSSLSSSTMKEKHCVNKRKAACEKIPRLPENIIIASNEDNPSEVNMLPKFSSISPKKIMNSKKSVMFPREENHDINKQFLPSKRCPAPVKNLTHFELSKNKTFVPNSILNDVPLSYNTNEMYNRLVHDRIRVLEQKEKILRRRSPIPVSISNQVLKGKPVRFSDYFCGFHEHEVPNFSQHPSASGDEKHTDSVTNKISADDISNDINRVQIKKKLLVLELSNAETQTEHVINDTDTVQESKKEETAKLNKSQSKSTNTSKSPKRNSYPSPIPKEKGSSDENIVSSKKKRNSKSHSCKRKQFRSKGVTVTVSNNHVGVSTNSSDTNSSDVVHSYSTRSSVESDFGVTDYCDSHKTVNIVVNVLSNSERKNPEFSDKRKNVAYMIPADEFKKVPNWRKLFDNEEKMTESSYFSPPDMSLKKPNVGMKQSIKSSGVTVEPNCSEESPDLGYYVQKLLLMRPESIENLDVSSCSTVPIGVATEHVDKKVKMKNRIKMPLYQNSFDETKIAKKLTQLPYYQNSFDDTMDAVCELMLNSRRHDTTLNDDDSTCSTESERFDSSPARVLKYLSSISDSSKFPDGNVIPFTSTCEKKGSQLKSVQSSFSKSGKVADKNKRDETDEDPMKLPTIEELLKRGFVSEMVLNQKSVDEQETMEEEEFLKQLVTVNVQSKNGVENSSDPVDSKSSSPVERLHDINETNLREQLPEDSAYKIVEHSLSVDKKSDKPLTHVKGENRLLGWMGTTVQRTLQASAINSTSSGDSSDPLRQTHQTLGHLVEEPFENSIDTDSLTFGKQFSLSPIKVPDINLSIFSTFKNS